MCTAELSLVWTFHGVPLRIFQLQVFLVYTLLMIWHVSNRARFFFRYLITRKTHSRPENPDTDTNLYLGPYQDGLLSCSQCSSARPHMGEPAECRRKATWRQSVFVAVQRICIANLRDLECLPAKSQWFIAWKKSIYEKLVVGGGGGGRVATLVLLKSARELGLNFRFHYHIIKTARAVSLFHNPWVRTQN